MSNATSVKSRKAPVLAMAVGLGMAAALGHATQERQNSQGMTSAQLASETLSPRQQAIVPIAAFAAAGDISRLGTALNQGLDAGLTVSDAREVLVQLYAYAGFPRSLNALAELMTVLEARKQRGIQDAPGRVPSRAIPKGEALLAAGTANQTKLTGAPVRGPLFDFAPAIDEYLKTTCSATSSSATTSIGKAASWRP
jgi:4-carboxymuconolactone decarboxylase